MRARRAPRGRHYAAPMPVVLDEGRFPVVRAHFVGRITDDELATYEERILALLRRCDADGVRFALITTGGNRLSPLSSKQRRSQAEFVSRHRTLAHRVVAGNAIVVTNPIHRGVIRSILWLVTPPYPLVVVATEDEAEARCRSFLAERRDSVRP